MKTLIMPGNHDYLVEDYYTKYFGHNSEFDKNSPVQLNYSPSGRSSYMKVKGGSYNYLLIALSWYDFDIDLPWFEEILKSNSDIPTMEIKFSEISFSNCIAGEFHNHTYQSNDASEKYMSLENVLNVAFREDIWKYS